MDEEDDIWKQFLEQDDDDLTVPSQVLSDSYLIGFVIANIVGLRYYSGIINGRELVGLVREPLNPFDPNAIKVLNTRTVQVGHIERTVAAVLAPLLDSRIISAVEAIVPKPPARGRNPYRLPCQIHIFALPDSIPTVQCAIEDGGLHLFTPDDHEFALSESGIVKESTSSNASKERRRIDEIFALVGKEGKGIEPLEPPKDVILTDLFAHQKEGLGWLVHRENSQDLPLFWKEKNGAFLNVLTNHQTNERPEPLRGGIFADDMGLGKTLTLLSLIASNKPGTSVSYTMVNDVGTSSGTRKRKSGNKRAVGSRKKRKADVGGFLDSKDEVLGPKTTLVVCPSSVLTTWIAQLEKHTRPGSLQVYLYHGERRKEVDLLLRHDIVLTTYKTLALEFSSPQSPLKEIEWLRVILDEAHVIKNFASQQTKAVFELKAERRWVVTGTPIQNSSFDLFSLMAFLRFLPFSIKSYWQSLVQRPLDQGSTSGISRLQALMASISLRRMKGTHNGSNSLVGLPPKTVETCLVELSSEEREQYEKMESEAKSTLREYINADTVLRNYSTVLHIILRLRQICNNVALCPSDLKSLLSSNSLEDASKNPELLRKLASMLEDGDDFDCPVCLSPPAKTIITRCAHIFCKSCILKTLKTLNPRCPICRQPLSETDLFLAPKPKPSDENPATDFSASPSSSKVSALLRLLLESKGQKESTKSVVFSQFRKMLILLEEPLMAAGFGVVRLDGSMSVKKRAEVMKEFGSNRSNAPTVLLASLKAAGAGIDLAVASRVYLVEPWWNPAAEEQAMDRVHRIGQKEEVKVVRLIVKDSIEERIMAIQERKKTLAGGLFGKKDAKEQKEMRVEDIRAMLRL